MIETTISTKENLVQDISNELIFGHTHNGVKCAACPTAKRACDRAWFSAKQIENWSGMSTKTLWRRLNELEECERISRLSDLTNVDIPTETNPIATVQSNELIFGQKHNDIDCALCPTATRACDRAWVTAKQIENWSKMSKTTLWRWLEKLEKARRIASFSDMKKTPILDSAGVPHETTLYNLNVQNHFVEMARKTRKG